MGRIFLYLLVSFLFLHCQADQSFSKPHHKEGGFRNPNPAIDSKGFGSVLVWQMGRWKLDHSLDPKDYSFPILSNDGASLRANEQKLSVTWIGHATTLVQIDGVNILTDPIWSERCSPVGFAGPKRYTPPGLTWENLPKIDLVLLSHNHYDHTDLPSLREIEKRFHPLFITGLGNAKWLRNEGLTHVVEKDWWESERLKGLEIHFTPTQHFSGRGLFDRDETLWGSYAILGSKEKVYFAGDTGYYTHFREIGERFGGFDVAILPIGAFEPRWLMKPVHVNPEEAVQSFIDLRAKYLVPMHYMTFVLSDEPLDSPLERTKVTLSAFSISLERLIGLKIGETRFF